MIDKYTYTAVYEDNTVIEKDENDVSKLDSTKSSFFDVLEKAKESKLISFVLHSDVLSWGVDLRDGHFELNGIPFFQHRPDEMRLSDLRLIYYKTSQRSISLENMEDLGGGILSHTIGWQTTINGSNVQRTITIPNLEELHESS